MISPSCCPLTGLALGLAGVMGGEQKQGGRSEPGAGDRLSGPHSLPPVPFLPSPSPDVMSLSLSWPAPGHCF